MGNLTARRALVTGAGRGIGAAVVRRLADEGAAVAVNYRTSADDAEALVSELRSRGTRAVALQADVSELSACRTLIDQVVAELGGIDVLVCNAGLEHFGSLDSITEDDFWRVFAINVGAQLFCVQAAAAHMRSGGRIVCTSSVSARTAVFEHTLYAASKAAVSSMVLNLAPELAQQGIAINAVAPGGTRSPMSEKYGERYAPLALRDLPGAGPAMLPRLNSAVGRLAEPEEIAAAIAFLSSPDASYVTGSTLSVDGGLL